MARAVQSLIRDFRHALRAFGKRPLYAGLTILVLAIAIGANATVFSVLSAFFLRPLPYPDSERLVMVYDSMPKIALDDAGTAIPDYLERREQAPSLENLAIYTGTSRTLSGDGSPERVLMAFASASLFDVLRIAPSLGRAFTDDEAVLGADRVVVLSHRLWNTRFGARAGIVGSDIRLDGETFRVIGVMPEGFGFPTTDFDVWAPFAFTPEQTTDAGRGFQFSNSIGRLRSGATIDGLNEELAAIVRRNVEQGRVPAGLVEVTGFTGRAASLRATRVGSLEQMVWLLQALVLAVLLIACANVANFQLTRVAARHKELAVRAALGAAGGELVRLVLVESLALALAGGALGLLVAFSSLDLVRVLGLDRADQGFDLRLDGSVLAFTFGAAVVAAFVAALPPVFALLRADLTRTVHQAGRQSGGDRSAQRLRSGLVVAQLALCVALLVGAGLLTKSFVALQREGPGFDANGVWTAALALPRSGRYADPESWPALQSQALSGLRALPGVTAAGFTTILPFFGNNSQGTTAIDGYVPPPGAPEPHAQHRYIDEGYLAALGVPVIAGRGFAATEAERVAIVDENLAKRYWPNGNALGQRLRRNNDPADQWATVVGVVPAVKQSSLADSAVKETVYWHYRQRPSPEGVFALRTALPPEEITRAASAVIASLDPDLALFNIVPMDLRVQRSLGPQRTPMALTLVFAAVAFTLAVIGIYGMLTWAVTQRVGEIGVRMALGARAADVMEMVMRQGGRMIVIGLGVGVVAALAVGRLLAAQIGAVSPADPLVFVIVVVGLTAAALLACWLPARRAARIDPMQALRAE